MPELLALAWLMPVLLSERECSKAKRENNADKSGTQSGSDDDGVSSARAKDEDEKHHFLSHKIARGFLACIASGMRTKNGLCTQDS